MPPGSLLHPISETTAADLSIWSLALCARQTDRGCLNNPILYGDLMPPYGLLPDLFSGLGNVG